MINLGILRNLCISIAISIHPVYPGSLAKDLLQQVNSEECGVSILHRFCSPSKKRPSILWWYTLKGHKQRTLSLEGITLKDTNLPLGWVSTSVIPSRPRWSRKNILFVWLSPGEKKVGPNQLFLYGVFDHRWHEFQLKYWWLCFDFCKIQAPDPVSGDLWWHQHGHICHLVVTIEKPEKRSYLIQFHLLPCN